jgi:hypothetical protein
MHKYSNTKRYAFNAVRSNFTEHKEHEPEPESEFEPENFPPPPKLTRETKYLPGERLLKSINKTKIKKGKAGIPFPLDLKILERSISSIVNQF